MRRIVVAGLLALLAVAPVGPASATTPGESKALLRVASRLSGLSVRRAVPVVVERPARFSLRRAATVDRLHPAGGRSYDETLYRALGLTPRRGGLRKALVSSERRAALYDRATRRVHVPSRKTARAALLTELVHALQDQHFGVRRARAVRRGRDASLAATAATEGQAALVAGLLGARALSGHGGSRLQRFLELERGFVDAVGLRFAADLRNLGGNRAVLSALRRFPESTEQVFHLDKFLEREPPLPIVLPVEAAGLQLGGDDTFGELDVRALLAAYGVPRLDHAGAGWGGGRSALYRGGGREAVAIALDWDTEHDAAEWSEAVATFVNEAFDAEAPGRPASTPCTATVCWSIGTRGIAFHRNVARTVLVLSGELALATGVAHALLPS